MKYQNFYSFLSKLTDIFDKAVTVHHAKKAGCCLESVHSTLMYARKFHSTFLHDINNFGYAGGYASTRLAEFISFDETLNYLEW